MSSIHACLVLAILSLLTMRTDAQPYPSAAIDTGQNYQYEFSYKGPGIIDSIVQNLTGQRFVMRDFQEYPFHATRYIYWNPSVVPGVRTHYYFYNNEWAWIGTERRIVYGDSIVQLSYQPDFDTPEEDSILERYVAEHFEVGTGYPLDMYTWTPSQGIAEGWRYQYFRSGPNKVDSAHNEIYKDGEWQLDHRFVYEYDDDLVLRAVTKHVTKMGNRRATTTRYYDLQWPEIEGQTLYPESGVTFAIKDDAFIYANFEHQLVGGAKQYDTIRKTFTTEGKLESYENSTVRIVYTYFPDGVRRSMTVGSSTDDLAPKWGEENIRHYEGDKMVTLQRRMWSQDQDQSDYLGFTYPLVNAVADEMGNGDIRVYPNPAANTITLSGTKEGQTYEIANCLGQIILTGNTSETSSEIKVGELAPGQYSVIVQKATSIPFVKY